MMYKTRGCLFKLNNKSKKNKIEGEEAPGYACIAESSLVVNRSTEVHLGVIIITGAVENRKEHHTNSFLYKTKVQGAPPIWNLPVLPLF